MLQLTESAVSAIHELVDADDVASTAGLRLTVSTDESSETNTMIASVAAAPEPGDEVIEANDARVYLDQRTAAALEDLVLDADTTEQGQFSFELGPQPPQCAQLNFRCLPSPRICWPG